MSWFTKLLTKLELDCKTLENWWQIFLKNDKFIGTLQLHLSEDWHVVCLGSDWVSNYCRNYSSLKLALKNYMGYNIGYNL